MVKKILFVMMLILPLGMMAQNYKFGHVYMSEIMVLMPEYKTAQDEMQEIQKKYVDEINMADQELQKKYTEYMNQRDSLPPSIQERREKEIQDLAQRGEEFKTQVQQILGQKQQELTDPIIKKATEAYIFDLSQTPIPFINEQQSTDVTADVKAKLGIQ